MCVCVRVCGFCYTNVRVCHVVMWPKNFMFSCRGVHSDCDVNAIRLEDDLSKFIKPVLRFTRTFSLLY